MHEKHTTRGCIVSASAYREADKIVSIYTESFGLVSARATGVRSHASKLRYHAQDYSVRLFSLVRGRDLWQLTSAEEIVGGAPIKSPDALAAYARVLSLVRRLVRGEERNEGVFGAIFGLHEVLANGIAEGDLAALEAVAVFRILHALGYIQPDAETALFISSPLDAALAASAKPLSKRLIAAINSGLAESHL